jgi:hypothetical protein
LLWKWLDIRSSIWWSFWKKWNRMGRRNGLICLLRKYSTLDRFLFFWYFGNGWFYSCVSS